MDRGEHTELPLSTAQVGMWIRHQLDPSGRAGTLAEYLDIRGPIDPVRWAAAWRTTLAEAEAGRVRFVETDDGPAQVLTPPAEPRLVDVASSDEAASWVRGELGRPMDLRRGAVDGVLLRLGAERFWWYQRVHHVALDYYGVVLMTRRLADVYSALVAGRPVPPPTFGRLADVLAEDEAYQRSAERAADRTHWLEVLRARPEPPDVLGRPSTDTPTIIGRAFLPSTVARGLRPLVARAGASWSRVLVAATAAYRWRLSGERDVVAPPPIRRWPRASR